MGLRRRYKYFGSILTQVYSKMSRCPICTQRAAGAGTTCTKCRFHVHYDTRCSTSPYLWPRCSLCVKCVEETVCGP